jgi:hypothetical protein
MLCTLWDPIVFTSMEYIKMNCGRGVQIVFTGVGYIKLNCGRGVQIVFTGVGYIKLDNLFRKMYYTNCV